MKASTRHIKRFIAKNSLYTVNPVCNDRLYNEIYYMWFMIIQWCVSMQTEGTNLLLLKIPALGNLDELQKADK